MRSDTAGDTAPDRFDTALGGGSVSLDEGVNGRFPTRWTLTRAGITNVYQYEDEILHFGGGRLLLRGVNGSGKSTAMNMLLPFLLTARMNRIDAAGEQTGVLRSWMLSGREEAQPVGYLWIEFQKGTEFLVCGCGIKANRSVDNVNTWWFITERRPGIDLALVESGVPLSVDALRAEVGRESVFSHDRRRDYRSEVGRVLFGGAALDQHIHLLNAVRNPRVGDRIDVDLPAHLTEALPELSEQALSEAARPLDDLDEHRRNVTALTATAKTLGDISTVYQGYVLAELHHRIDTGRDHLTAGKRCSRDLARQEQAAAEANGREQAAAKQITRLAADESRLNTELSALRSDATFNELRDLRAHVASLDKQCGDLGERCGELETRGISAANELKQAEAQTDGDATALAAELAELARLGSHVHLAARTPSPPSISRTKLANIDATAPDAGLDHQPLTGALGELTAAVTVRSGDVGDVGAKIDAVDSALAELQRAESTRDGRSLEAAEAEAAFVAARATFSETKATWDENLVHWAAEAVGRFQSASTPAPNVHRAAGASQPSTVEPPADAPSVRTPSVELPSADRAATRGLLLAEMDSLLSHRQRAAAIAEREVDAARHAVGEASERVSELDAQTEPDPPVLAWQERNQCSLADLVDFADHLSSTERAGLESALEASGLLSATVQADGLQLQTGELIAVPNGQTARPLSKLLTVTVPSLDLGEIDPGMIAKVLDSISTDVGSDAGTVIGTDGTFRLGSLRGRHLKEQAEYIGITARRATLERLRAEAAAVLVEAEADLAAAAAGYEGCLAELGSAEATRQALPDLREVDHAQLQADHCEQTLASRRDLLAGAEQQVADADATHANRCDERDRTAATLQLPSDRADLDRIESTLRDIVAGCSNVRQLIRVVDTSFRAWRRAVGAWRLLEDDLDSLRSSHERAVDEHQKEASRLATLEDTQGLAYREIVEAIAVSEADLARITAELPTVRQEREDAVLARAEAIAQAGTARERKESAEQLVADHLRLLHRTLDVPGLLATVVTEEESASCAQAEVAPNGLGDLLELLGGILPPAQAESTTADGVRISLRRRRDSLGAGWDAEDRQPDLELPLAIHVEGPLGHMPLAQALGAAEAQLSLLTGLLTTKQDNALRNLLQGLVAKEVAEKLDRANRLVSGMNEHLSKVSTAHGLGVELRWRRTSELDRVPKRMIDLLAKLPDLRTEDEESELRALLSEQLDEARRLNPEDPYRELIAQTLDYRQWHDMTVLIRRGAESPAKLNRKTPLSEGEKKLVTYLPFLAAVAVSCDALSEHAPHVPRFVLLDDAMAKVSEDNHAELLGLLVDLDLDFIATSERLWGTHATVPQLAITEVIRDAELGVILLEHSYWDGRTLTRSSDGLSPPLRSPR